MSQNSIEGLPRFIGYDVLVLNTGDDLCRPTAMTANLDIDIEDSLESLGQDIATCRSAQYNLGVMHNNGEGVPQDYVQAHMWWNLAAVSGDEDAIGNRNIVAEDMTPAQLAEAQKLAREWKPTD